MKINELTHRQRFARTSAFRWLALKLRDKEKKIGKKISKNARRRLAVELDCEIMMKIMFGFENEETDDAIN